MVNNRLKRQIDEISMKERQPDSDILPASLRRIVRYPLLYPQDKSLGLSKKEILPTSESHLQARSASSYHPK